MVAPLAVRFLPISLVYVESGKELDEKKNKIMI